MARDPSPGFYTNIKTPRLPAVRNERGRFVAAKQAMEAQNRQMAVALQAQVARTIESRIMRKGVSTGRLIKATLEPENAVYNDTYVGVGNEKFLDRSIAKYWRTIEEGSAKTWTKRSFLTLELQGLWGTNVAGWRTGPSGDWVALGGGSLGPVDAPSRRGSSRQEMYHPFRFGKGANLPVFHPTRQIRPMNAYRDVKRDPQWDARALAISDQFLRRIANTSIRPSGFPG